MVPQRFATPGILTLSLILVALVLYGSTTSGLIRLWTSPDTVTYGHGLLLLAVGLYVGYRDWRLSGPWNGFRPSVPGLVFLSAISVLWFLADLGSVQVIQQVMLVVLPIGIAWAAFGLVAARILLLPVLLVLCAVPIWEIVNQGHLQQLTALFVAKMVALTGHSIYREGMLLVLPAGSFLVAENCSGMRQLMAAVPIGLLYSWMNGFGVSLSVLYTMAAAAVAILVNTVRIYIVVMAGQLTDMQHYFVTTDHVTLGWVLFGIGMTLFILVSSRLPALRRADAVAGDDVRLQGGEPSPPSTGTPLLLKGMVFAAIGLVVGPALAGWYAGGRDEAVDVRLELPDRIGAWEAAPSGDEYRPHVHGEDAVHEARYRSPDGGLVTLHLYYFHHQTQDREAVSSFHRVYDGEQWWTTGRAERRRSVSDTGLTVIESEITSRAGRERLVWRWYEVAHWRTADRSMAKLHGIRGLVIGRPDATLVVVSANMDAEREVTERLLAQFTDELLPLLGPVLARAAASAHETH